MRDIYNPPPAPFAYAPPRPEPVTVGRSDVAWLAALLAVLAGICATAFSVEPILGIGVTIGGLFVVLESWFSGLTYLHRHPEARVLNRWLIFVAALAPWLVGLGFAAAMMWGLFLISDYSV